MGRILLCYDTQDKDLARDVRDFLTELDVEVEMIPRFVQDKEVRPGDQGFHEPEDAGLAPGK